MCSKSKNGRDFVGFFPGEARGFVDGVNKINDPLIKRSIFDREEG